MNSGGTTDDAVLGGGGDEALLPRLPLSYTHVAAYMHA